MFNRLDNAEHMVKVYEKQLEDKFTKSRFERLIKARDERNEILKELSI